MAEFSFLKKEFTAGQVSRKLARRTDNTAYVNGVLTMSNARPLIQGGVQNREGTRYVAGSKDHSKKSRLEGFVYDQDDSYILEFGEGYIRFYRDGGQILESDITITGITKANPAVVTAAGHGYSNGDQVYITSVAGMTEVNNSTQYYIVANKTSTTFELTDQDGNNVDSSSFTTYSSGGVSNRIYTITTDYLESDVFDLVLNPKGNAIYITHPDYSPKRLLRSGHTSWTLTSLMKDGDDTSATLVIQDGPYESQNTTSTTFTLSGGSYAPGDSPTLTASSVTGINDGSGFQTTDVGRLVRIKDTGGNWGWGEITARSSATVVTLLIHGDETLDGDPHTEWKLGAWSETTKFPSHSKFYQGRIWYAGKINNELQYFYSQSQDFENFLEGTNDDEAGSGNLSGHMYGNSDITAMAAGVKLQILVNGGMYTIDGSYNDPVLTPSNNRATPHAIGPSKNIQPLEIKSKVVYVSRTGRELRSTFYSFENDSYAAVNLNSINDEIIENGIVQLAYQDEPHTIIWGVDSGGDLIGLTYEPSEEVIGFHTHSIGGSGIVESVAAQPTPTQDRIWLVVKRTINGSTRRYIEYISNVFRNTDIEDAIFVDSALVISPSTPSGTITPAATEGTNVILTSSAGVFSSTDVGRVIRGNGGKAEIVKYNSPTEVLADVLTDFADTTTISNGSWTISVGSVSGLDHLEGETVSILTDGYVHPNETVTSGSITLDYQATEVTVGEGYTSTVELLPTDFGSKKGSAFGSTAMINKVIVNFIDTVGGWVGADSTSMQEIAPHSGTDSLGEPVQPYTKDIEVSLQNHKDGYISCRYEQRDPLPFTINSMTIVGKVSDA